MRRFAPAAVLALVPAFVACPPPHIELDAGPDPVDAGSAPADGYCEAIADFFCAFYLRCGRMAVADEAACRPVFLEACNGRYEPSYLALEAAGLLTLSAAGIEQCRAHLESAACDDVQLELQGPCSAMWVGTQPAGAPCGFDVESFTCAPGTACVVDLSFCGVCTAMAADGASCAERDITCGADSFCGETGLCTTRRRVGETCGSGDRCVLGTTCTDTVCTGPSYTTVGEACDFDTRCPYASRCLDGTCVAAVGLGQSCGPTAPCDSGWCDDGTCAPFIAQDEACTDGDQCQTGVCSGGTCAAHPSACFNP
ncbi:MAG: hypothetical protein A2138_04185 [Deltaproteobacteria bacterium RBG_16_71_12]|nr:MAG: hypothetical protein A2138_04185 [Deltaproteobacteria bacterium RBG_16_71_12]